MTEDVEILEEKQTCDNCAIRAEGRRLAKEVGSSAAVDYRMPFCVTCEKNPQMAMGQAIFRNLGFKNSPIQVVNNWRPVEP